MSISPEASIDYERLMQANLVRVFGERDAKRRIAAISELYAEVDALLSSLPPNFAFTAIGPAVGHHGVGRLRWQSGPPNGPVAVTGTDVARIESGRIQTLHVFIDPTGA